MSLEMAKSWSFGRPFGLYREPPLNRAVGHSAACLRVSTGQTPQGTGQLSGARWPSACHSFERQPFNSNGHEPFSSRCPLTGQNSVHSSRHRTNVRCVSSSRTELNREHSPTGQKGTGQTPCPVLCPVRSTQRQTARVSHRTERRGTGHVRCVPRASVRCFAPLCLARPRASLHRTVATGQHLSVRCSVRCSSEHFSQLLSPPLLTTTNTKVFHHLVHVC
jgi:hypothetical protein